MKVKQKINKYEERMSKKKTHHEHTHEMWNIYMKMILIEMNGTTSQTKKKKRKKMKKVKHTQKPKKFYIIVSVL